MCVSSRRTRTCSSPALRPARGAGPGARSSSTETSGRSRPVAHTARCLSSRGIERAIGGHTELGQRAGEEPVDDDERARRQRRPDHPLDLVGPDRGRGQRAWPACPDSAASRSGGCPALPIGRPPSGSTTVWPAARSRAGQAGCLRRPSPRPARPRPRSARRCPHRGSPRRSAASRSGSIGSVRRSSICR